MKTWFRPLCAALCLCLLLVGCDGGKSADGPTPTVQPTDAAQPTEPTDYSKYNTYIDLADEMSEMEAVLEVYFDNVVYQEEFALAEGGDYAAIKDAVQFYTGLSYTAEKALDYADEEPSYPELDAAVLALGDSPSRVMDALDHLGSYMRFDDYVDDDMARAPELHAELWKALETYDAYYPQFLSALSDQADQGEEDALNELKEAGETIRYQSRVMIRAAEDIQGAILEQVDAAAEADPEAAQLTLPVIDMTDVSPLFAQFQAAYEALTAALDDEAEVEKVFSGQMAENAKKLYANKVDALYVQVGGLAQALMEETDYADAFSQAGEAIDDMISAYNSVN